MNTSENRLSDLPDVLDVSQAATVLRVSKNTCYEAVGRGELAAVRIGRRILVPKLALIAFLGGGSESDAAGARCLDDED